MKKLIFLLLTAYSYGQNSGIGTSTPHTSAALEVQSTTQGVIPPKMTTAQRNDIIDPVAGLLIYNITTNCIEAFNGTVWVNGCSGSTIYGEPAIVHGAAGKIWMAYNLGATAPATSPTDYTQYGSLYQWGRGNDGHQLIIWTSANAGSPVNGNTTTLSTTDTPANSLFITTSGGNNLDWRSPKNDALWQGVNGINNPCPVGFRPPTDAEFAEEVTKGHLINGNDAFYSSALKFTWGGYRSPYAPGNLTSVSLGGVYWSSTINGNRAFNHTFMASGISRSHDTRSDGNFVRCIKD